jgi:cobalt-precorrin 5A hydrolase/precorrin-3B C17-methyltransferase
LLSPVQQIVASPLGSEMARAEQAIDLAAGGRRVALISSGDIGIYAMAGPVFEALRRRGWQGAAPELEVFPGVSAVQAVAARLGAPIGHDFCTISLSDLLTPWATIERRIWAAARADFVIAFYNPRSRDRDWQLARAMAILRQYRTPGTPVAVARNITRPDQTIALTALADFDPASVDMFTLVLIGNSQSFTIAGHMATPRGYTGAQAQADTGAQTQELDRSGSAHPQALASAAPLGTYPITLTHMRGAAAIVVGGGPVAERKARGLLAAGAVVRVVSPQATEALRALAQTGAICWDARPYQDSDLDDRPRLVFAATNQHHINAQVARDAVAHGLLCNVADAPDAGSFHLPAVYRHAGVVLAVSTAGESPARAVRVRDALAAFLEQNAQEPI